MSLRARWLTFVGVLALVGTGALAYQVYILYTDVEDLEDAPVVQVAELEALQQDLRTAEEDIAFLETKVRSIPPAFDPSDINSRLNSLRSDVNFLEGQFYRFVQAGPLDAGVVEAGAIDKPAFCLAGDPVYWDYGDGLTC